MGLGTKLATQKRYVKVIRMFYLEQLVMSEFFQTKNLSLSVLRRIGMYGTLMNLLCL